MKQYQVYGMGNALVDIDFEVKQQTIERLNIDKGVMTLIDEETHHRLLEELDGVKHLKECGGSAGNTIFTLQQLGAKTFFSCKVGNDEFGNFYFRSLISEGINTNLDENSRRGITGKCIVLVTPDADRTMNTFLGTTSTFSKEELSEAALKDSEYLYIEGFLVASPTGYEAAIVAREIAQKYGIKISLCLSDPNMVIYFKSGLQDIIGKKQIDIIFSNEREALLFTESNHLDDAKEKLKQYAKSFVITLGDKGALIYDGKKFGDVSAYPVKVLDTVGAGDIFAGAFLYGITHGRDYFDSGKLASYAASKIVSKFGPRLNKEEINSVKNILGKNSNLSKETIFCK
ncbi:MAG TPA: adenosine kinase [Verrucomicrobiae bacterium]|nr:adenosine kinase [Verrucomicrobiae bacterium]